MYGTTVRGEKEDDKKNEIFTQLFSQDIFIFPSAFLSLPFSAAAVTRRDSPSSQLVTFEEFPIKSTSACH